MRGVKMRAATMVAVLLGMISLVSGCGTNLGGGNTDMRQYSIERTVCVEDGGTPLGETLDELQCVKNGDSSSVVTSPEAPSEVPEAADPVQSGGEVSATLPEEGYDEATVSRMVLGDVGYTTSWGMWFDLDRKGWLHPDYTISSKPFGTSKMRVERHEDGYHVWLVPDEKYSPQKAPSYMSPADTKYIPVIALHQ